MATSGRGSRRKLPNAALAAVPAPLAHSVTADQHAVAPMTAAEAAPALEAAHDRADIAAAALIAPEALAPPVPATPSPKPDVDPAPTDVTSAPTATEPAKTADATKDTSMDTMNTSFDASKGQAQTQAMFADANDRAKGAMEKGAKFFTEMAEFNKGTLEAMVESSKIAARGVESMGQDAAAYAKTSFETSTAAMREFAAVKSPAEFMRLQADYARQAFDAMVAHASKSTEASLKLAGEVAQPISNRVALAADKMKVTA